MKSKDYYVIIFIVMFFTIVLISHLVYGQSYDAYEIYDLDMYEQQTFDLIYKNDYQQSQMEYLQREFEINQRRREHRRQIEEMERRIEQLENNQRKDW